MSRASIAIFGDDIDPKALAQFRSAMEQEWAVRGALMPDAHVGYALPIGAVVATRGVVVPAWVGYDIGCGMCALPTTFAAAAVTANAEAVYRAIYAAVPVGFDVNKKGGEAPAYGVEPGPELAGIIARKGGDRVRGSLGGGNHFIEIGRDEEDTVWIVIHSGSRGIGHDCARYHMCVAGGTGTPREGHFPLAVDAPAGRAYLRDQDWCLAFALANRREIAKRVVAVVRKQVTGRGCWSELINRNHNHAEERDGLWIHRKGATHAEAGMLGVIPGNMRDGSFIVRGRGDPRSLCSSSHGAGRVMGRREAKPRVDMADFKAAMGGVRAKVTPATLDESPMAYKNIHVVMEQQRDLVEVLHHVRPLINIKG